jgi:hypothetical protein
MLSVSNKPYLLSVVMLNVVILSVVIQDVIMLSVIMLTVVVPYFARPKRGESWQPSL